MRERVRLWCLMFTDYVVLVKLKIYKRVGRHARKLKKNGLKISRAKTEFLDFKFLKLRQEKMEAVIIEASEVDLLIKQDDSSIQGQLRENTGELRRTRLVE